MLEDLISNIKKKKQILQEVSDYNLRSRPYVNLSFDGMFNGTGNFGEVVNSYDGDEDNSERFVKEYVNFCYNNVVKVIDELTRGEKTIIYYGAKQNYQTSSIINSSICNNEDALDLGYLYRNIHFFYQNKDWIVGRCNNEELLNVVYGIVGVDFASVFENDEFGRKVIPIKSLFYFPKKKLFFYLYDHRGGIICSLHNNEILLRKYFYKFEELKNNYWEGDTKKKLHIL